MLSDLRFGGFDLSFEGLHRYSVSMEALSLNRNFQTGPLVLLSDTRLEYGKSRMYSSIVHGLHEAIYPVKSLMEAMELLPIDPKVLTNIINAIDELEDSCRRGHAKFCHLDPNRKPV